MTKLLSAVLLTVTAVAADPIVVAGNWTLTGDVQGYPINESCTLTQTAAVIAGNCTEPVHQKVVAVTGSATDKTITFSHPGEYQGQPLTLTYAGTMDANGKLQGTIDVQPLDYQGTFTAVKSATQSTPAAAPAQ